MQRSRRSTTIVAGLGGVAALIVVIQVVPSASAPPVLVRGVPADPETFSLTALQDAEDRAFVEVTRDRLHDACMAEKGFPEIPDDESVEIGAYNEASFGEDPEASGPPEPRRVTIAPGVTAEISASWTSDSCLWQAGEALGVDPLVREALRQRMMALVTEGDNAAEPELADLAATWGECLGRDVVPAQDLLNVLDNVERRNPYGDAAGGCLTEDIAHEAKLIRAQQHLSVAADNEDIVAAWVELVDAETAAARSFGS